MADKEYEELYERGDLRYLDSFIENYNYEFNFIKRLLQEDRDNLFLGVRGGYLNIYYLGGSLAKINLYLGKESKMQVGVHHRYLELTSKDKDDPYIKISFEEFEEKYEEIKKAIEEIARGKRNSEGTQKGKVSREKILQQWIINTNNTQDSNWYYVDMEYSMKGIAFGRFDMIAISRKPNLEGNHQIALIELKLRRDSYGGFSSSDYEDEKVKKLYDEVKDGNIYASKYRDMKYKSGLLGHMTNYMRFLNSSNYDKLLKKEIINFLKWHEEFGILSDDLKNIDEGSLSIKPDIYFVTYTNVPTLDGDIEDYIKVEELISSFSKYMFSSKYSVKEMINEEQIKGLLEVESKFCDEENLNKDIGFKMNIANEDYNFNFIFIDAKDSDKEHWNCLK